MPGRASALAAHQMPEPSRAPWTADQMPWTSAAQPQFRSSGVVEFKGDFADTTKFVHKRKADYDVTRCVASFMVSVLYDSFEGI